MTAAGYFQLTICVCLSILLVPLNSFGQETVNKGFDRLQANLEKINRSIETTKEKIKSVNDARFLPDLYFTLAELYVDQSRYMYQIKVNKNKKTPFSEVDFANERRPKLLAIETFQMILEKFPNIAERDKALFYMAHEFRELGRNDEMAATYQRLTKEFPRSTHWAESQLMLGNYFFESKKDFEFAIGLYKKIVDREDSGPFIPLAQYKMGWVYINLSKFKEALLSFEAVLKQDKKVDLSLLPEVYRKTDVRRDALVSMVRPYSELKPEELDSLGPERRDPLRYFVGLSPERASYQKVLRVLGRRLTVKGKFVPATRTYFELLRLSGDTETRMEAIERLYESLQSAKVRWPVNFLVDEIATTLIRIKSNRRIPAREREKIMDNYEIIARDAATRFQERAESSQQPADYRAAAHAYEVYLELFPSRRNAELIRQNLAETLYKLRLWVPAGRAYEATASERSGKDRRAFYDSAIQSYINALRKPDLLSRVELTQARNGLRDIGFIFLKEFPKDKLTPTLRFNIGRTYYDERDFDRAVRAFENYIKAHPNHSEVRLSVDLILDSFNQREDYGGLVRAGQRIIQEKNIAASIRREVQEIIRQAEYKRIQSKTGDFTSRNYTQDLLKFAAQYKGSQIGDQALFEAFTALKSKRDPQAYQPGEQLLIDHENSRYAKDVVADMGRMALLTADFRRAARYFEIFARKYGDDKEAKNLLRGAAQFRELLGEFNSAGENFTKLGLWDNASRAYSQGGFWNELRTSAQQVGGLRGVYWQGLAAYRLSDPEYSKYLQQASRMPATDFEENSMASHALFILSQDALKSYKSVEIIPGKETEAVKNKNQMLETLKSQLNTVIRYGNGRWTIAALFLQGQAHKEFGDFLRRAPAPPGLQGPQVQQYKDAINTEAQKYDSQANKIFIQCVANGEKYDIFTRFSKACASYGAEIPSEAEDTQITTRPTEKTPPEAKDIRYKLFEDGRSVSLLTQLSEAYTRAGDYAMALLILSRATEIQPDNATLLSRMAMNELFMNSLDTGFAKTQRALKLNDRDATALWIQAGLYSEFKYSKKFSVALKKARAAGKPAGPTHPWVKKLLLARP